MRAVSCTQTQRSERQGWYDEEAITSDISLMFEMSPPGVVSPWQAVGCRGVPSTIKMLAQTRWSLVYRNTIRSKMGKRMRTVEKLWGVKARRWCWLAVSPCWPLLVTCWAGAAWASCLQSCSRLRPGLDPSLAAATRLHNLTTVTQVTLLHRSHHSDIQLGWGNLLLFIATCN